MKHKNSYWLLSVIVLVLFACDDMKDKSKPISETGKADTTQLFILSEGLFNSNNSTLSLYNLNEKMFVADFFTSVNKRGLGDTGNDMGVYGSKLYVVMSVSSQIEVIDIKTGKSVTQIGMFKNNGIARAPRCIDFFNGKAYVCSYDGTLAKIDTTTLKIEAFVNCGKNPDGLCIANNKIFVSNSGGLNFPDYDNTISVIDIATFTEVSKITVGINPGKIRSDSYGDVYVVTRGNYGSTPYQFHRINSVTNKLIETFDDIHGLNFNIHNDTAYVYNYDYGTGTNWIKVFDCKTEKLITDNFISDKTTLRTPYGIDINPTNGDVYLTDAKSYTIWGDVLCFDKTGKLKFRLNSVGLNPNKVVFASLQ